MTVADLLLAREGDPSPGIIADGELWTWSDVVDAARVRAAVLDELVEGRTRHVGVLLENVPDYVFVLGGAALASAVVVGINPTRRGDELARDVRHTDCAVVLTDAAGASLLEGLDLGGARVLRIDGDEWASQLESHASAPFPDSAPAPEDLYLLIFTSGSTGAPKAVRVSHGRAAATAAATGAVFTTDDVLYCAMPLFHGNALFSNLFAAFVSGAAVVLRRRFSASAFVGDVRRYGCTFFNYVGRALSYILAVPESPEERDTRLRWGFGSEASPRDIAEFKRRFGVPIFDGYGSSEGAVVLQRDKTVPDNALGRAREGDDVAVVDPETGRECPRARLDADGRILNAGEAIGELVSRNALSRFEGYYANERADADRSRNGWYWTGDLAYRDEDDVFWFAGRGADWLRVDSENFAATPVERILGRFPGVASVAVYPVPDPGTGDQVMATIELDAGVTFDPAAFASFLAEQKDLGSKWAPRFVRVTDALPTTATGKLNKQPLRAERWSTDDPVWWCAAINEPYRLLTEDDIADLHQRFVAAGRASLLDA